MGLDGEVLGLCPQRVHMPCVSLNNFFHSPVPWFSHAENGAKPCADRVGAVMGHVLPSMLTLASWLAPTLTSVRGKLRCTREDPLCHAEPPGDCCRAGEAPLHLPNHSLFPGKGRLSPRTLPCMSYKVEEQWQGRACWGPRQLFEHRLTCGWVFRELGFS